MLSARSNCLVFPLATPLIQTQVRDALKQEFPSHDVVEFVGTGPIPAQLKTFATASLIVAPHGAGLSNMVVSPLHTPVLEIGPLGCPSCYTHLAIKVTSDARFSVRCAQGLPTPLSMHS